MSAVLRASIGGLFWAAFVFVQVITLQGEAWSHALMAFAALGVLAWRRNRGLVVASAAFGLLGYSAAHNDATFRFLYDHAPLFKAQRIPSRAEILTVWCVPILMALLGAWTRRFRRPVLNAAVGLLALGCVVLQFRLVPAIPPVVDARVEPQRNVFLQAVARDLGDMRLNLFENEGRHWGAEHVTMPLGIEGVVGAEPAWIAEYLSPQFYMPQQVAFLDAARANPARIWGLVSTRFAGSMTPRNVPGFTLRETTQRCPTSICQPAKSAGPYLYDNSEALPRMFTAGRVVLFVGHGREADLAFQSILLSPEWNPRRVVLVRAGLRGDAPTEAQVRAADLVVVHGSMELAPSLLALAPTVVREAGPTAGEGTGRALVLLAADADDVTALPMVRNGQEYKACPDSGKVLVTTSKFALVPGWRALDQKGMELPIFRANGVTTAVPLVLPDGQRATGCITFQYRPAYLAYGGGISLLSLPLTLALVLAPRRRKNTTPAPRPDA